ncbi:MAG: carbohydrate porin [Thiohalomonadales bacterium]|nr:carbohydrate porin [Thiohalomonadales bacterium]
MSKPFITGISLLMTLPLLHTTAAHAYEVNDKLSLGGVLAMAVQCQELSDAPGFSNTCETSAPFQPEFSFRPTDSDEVFIKFGFAAGNGLNNDSPFNISPWAADLENDVKNINGRNRDYLLTAWYRHTFQFADDQQLGTMFGIIDSTHYLDENVYANDEFTQFMNPVLTNGPNVFLPSYDLGAAVDWHTGPWSLHAVVMDVGENDDGNNYSFYGMQAGYTVHTSVGTGHYRVILAGASKDFLDPSGVQLESRAGGLLSFDQAFGQVVGGWLRVGWQTDDAAVDYHAIYSGGLDFKGSAWGRPDDNIGIGYAYLHGGNLAIDASHVAEAYYRWQLGEVLGLTADVQYQQDDYKAGGGPSGWIFGLRAAAEF